MKPAPVHPPHAFSLLETSLAAGIVATVALPVLTLLAGAGSLQSEATDRAAAARLARESVAELSLLPPVGTDRFLRFHEDWISLNESEGIFHAAFDAEGQYLGRIEKGDFQKGLPASGQAHHLLELTFRRDGELARLHLELSVEQPATAEFPHRSRERFLACLELP